MLAKLQVLRGTSSDIFGCSAADRLERDLLLLPDRIRGCGLVKEKAVTDACTRYDELMQDS